MPGEYAATALDRPKLTDEMLASWSVPAAAICAPVTSASRPSSRGAQIAAWIAIAILGVACGIASALFGIWLALG